MCTRKLGMSRDDASAAVEAVAGFHVVDTDRSLILEAAELATRAQLSILDAAIVGAASARRLPAAPDDDLGNGDAYGETVVHDPFA